MNSSSLELSRARFLSLVLGLLPSNAPGSAPWAQAPERFAETLVVPLALDGVALSLLHSMTDEAHERFTLEVVVGSVLGDELAAHATTLLRSTHRNFRAAGWAYALDADAGQLLFTVNAPTTSTTEDFIALIDDALVRAAAWAAMASPSGGGALPTAAASDLLHA
jgi:hypothetical protein